MGDRMARMVDVSEKEVVWRSAVAEGRLKLSPHTIETIADGAVKKGDVFTSSKLAGIQAAKATPGILPLCHQIPLTSVEVELDIDGHDLVARCTVSAEYRTGVEMEALMGVTVALLNAWDMVKYLEKNETGQYPDTVITGIRVLKKQKGGK